jgi:hypothetical protein
MTFLDTSAALKLVMPEAETLPWRQALDREGAALRVVPNSRRFHLDENPQTRRVRHALSGSNTRPQDRAKGSARSDVRGSSSAGRQNFSASLAEAIDANAASYPLPCLLHYISWTQVIRIILQRFQDGQTLPGDCIMRSAMQFLIVLPCN